MGIHRTRVTGAASSDHNQKVVEVLKELAEDLKEERKELKKERTSHQDSINKIQSHERYLWLALALSTLLGILF